MYKGKNLIGIFKHYLVKATCRKRGREKVPLSEKSCGLLEEILL